MMPINDSPYLVLVKSNDEVYKEIGRHFPLKKLTMIGSHAHCQIQLPESCMAPTNLKIWQKENSWVIEDVSEQKNLFVNDILTKRFPLSKDGEIFRVGPLTFKFFFGEGIESDYDQIMYENTIHDPLTQTYNRRYLMLKLADEISHIARKPHPLSIILMDIDHFKKINDDYGHLIGDGILKSLCERIKKRLRKEEPFIRYGGEEFSVILPETNFKAAYMVAEQLRQLVCETPFQVFNENLSITISIGVITIINPLPEEVLLRKVDEQLYLAKTNGRNCVKGFELI